VLHLVRLTGPDHQVVLINPDEVVSLREPRGQRGEHFAAGIACLVFTADGKYTAVTETCSEVRQRLEQSIPEAE
jgi:hypothetical protein